MISAVVLAAALTLPNATVTPGVLALDHGKPLTTETICTTKWGKDARHVTESMKKHVAALYSVAWQDRARYEFDHLISRELGGDDKEGNLWPQPRFGVWNAHRKDVLENKLHRLVCAGDLPLTDAQDIIAHDWIGGYRRFVETK